MINPLQIGVTALRAFGRKMGVSAHNVANINTDGFRPDRTQLREENGGVAARIQPPPQQLIPPRPPGDDRPGLSEVELSTEMTHIIAAKRGYQANIKMMQVADESEKSVLDILG